MNLDFDQIETQLIFQSIRSLATVAGLAGVVVVLIESGTGTFFETLARLAHASEYISGLVG